jgi:hypothetical protein
MSLFMVCTLKFGFRILAKPIDGKKILSHFWIVKN